jgi:tetratricopeptide (TPR) repeat protein
LKKGLSMSVDPGRRVIVPAICATFVLAAAAFTASYQREPGPMAAAPAAEVSGQAQAVPLTPAQQLWQQLNQAEKTGRTTEALAATEAIRAQSGDGYLINLRAGWLHYLQQDYLAAIASYRRAAVFAPGALAPLQGLLNCALAQGQTDQAIQLAKGQLVLDPMNAAANRQLADLYFQQNDHAAAEVLYLKLAILHPEDLEVACQLAWCQLRLDRPDQARNLFTGVLIASPSHPAALPGLLACNASKKE